MLCALSVCSSDVDSFVLRCLRTYEKHRPTGKEVSPFNISGAASIAGEPHNIIKSSAWGLHCVSVGLFRMHPGVAAEFCTRKKDSTRSVNDIDNSSWRPPLSIRSLLKLQERRHIGLLGAATIVMACGDWARLAGWYGCSDKCDRWWICCCISNDSFGDPLCFFVCLCDAALQLMVSFAVSPTTCTKMAVICGGRRDSCGCASRRMGVLCSEKEVVKGSAVRCKAMQTGSCALHGWFGKRVSGWFRRRIAQIERCREDCSM